jgi:hypothetical protein
LAGRTLGEHYDALVKARASAMPRHGVVTAEDLSKPR